MSLRNVRRVFAKELRETLRDRRTVLIMLVLPVFLYPALLVIVQQLLLLGQRSLEEEPVSVAVQGGSPELVAFLERDSALWVKRNGGGTAGGLRSGETDAILLLEEDAAAGHETQEARLLFDASRDLSRRARGIVESRLDEWGDTLLARRLRVEGLPESFATPLVVSDSSVASAERLGGYALGRFLPAILILMTLLGAFYPAIDLTAGEKERGTLETLLTTPVPAREIVAGKFLTVCTTALATATLNLVSMLLTFESGVFRISQTTDFEFRIPLATAALVMLFMLPLAVFFAAIFLGLAVRSHSFKEAQNTLTPVQLASIVPIYLPMIPGIPLSYGIALVPIGGIAVLFRDLMSGQAALGPGAVAVGAMVAYALLALRFASRAFGREEVLFGAGSGSDVTSGLRARIAAWRASGREAPRGAEALAFVAVVALLYFYIGVRLQVTGLEKGLFASQWLLLALPALLFAVVGPYRPRIALALRLPSGRAVLAAVLIIAGGMPLGWGLGWLQGFFLEIPEEFLVAFQRLLSAETPGRLAWLLILIAVTPAICEELVFRGILLQGLSRELPSWRAIFGSAVIFGAFHLSYETVIRFLPTTWLGLLMGFVVWHTRSLFTSMLMHFLANATAVLLVTTGGLQTHLFAAGGEPRWPVVAAGVALLAGGVALLPKRSDPGPPAAELGERLSRPPTSVPPVEAR